MREKRANPEQKRHPIQVVARRSGLSPDVLRAWEKRYSLVEPARSAGGRRLYSDADIERLRLVREAVAGGRRVGQLASLPVPELHALVEEDRSEVAQLASIRRPDTGSGEPDAIISECLESVRGLDSEGLRSSFGRAVIALQPTTFMDSVATPLMHEIGTLWAKGRLSPSHEHLASSVIRHTLAEVTAALQPTSGAPNIVVATPSGQRHGIGATLVAATAQLEGWRVTNLGEDLPAMDIAQAVEQTGATVLALSLTHPEGDPMTVKQLHALYDALPDGVPLLVGGQAAHSYQKTLESINAILVADLPKLREILRNLLRNGSSPPVH